MEVHAHSHLASGETHTARKKWTHYFWEFLMLFLAVFCGFLAENEREHMIEHRREKVFMHSLTRDLMLDTAALNLSNRFNIKKILSIDSFLQYSKENPDCHELYAEEIQMLAQAVTYRFFVHHSGTINQLENSGGMRLIRKKGIVDSIEAYYQQVTRMQLQNSLWLQYVEQYRQISAKLFNSMDRIKRMSPYNNMGNDWKTNTPNSITDRTPVRLNREFLNEFLNLLINIRNYAINTEISTNRGVFDKSQGLIYLIKKEYHLE